MKQLFNADSISIGTVCATNPKTLRTRGVATMFYFISYKGYQGTRPEGIALPSRNNKNPWRQLRK